MARPKKYTGKALLEGVEEYFDSISAVVDATIEAPAVMEDGTVELVTQIAYNRKGNPLQKTIWTSVPSVAGLCHYLNMHRDTWNAYEHQEEYREAVSLFYNTYLSYLSEELVDGQGKKAVQGVMFIMRTLGISDKPEQAAGGGQSLEEFLRDG